MTMRLEVLFPSLAPVAARVAALVGAVAFTVLASGAASAATGTPAPSRAEAAAKYADADSRFVDLDGVIVHYRDEGTGPAILLVHGTQGDLRDWDAWTAALKDRYRVVRLDLPAFGLTGPVPNGNYSIDRMLSLVDALMDTVGVDRFAITGVSFGGLVAFRYAATRTDRVSALILANSAGIEYGGRRGTGPRPQASSQGAGVMTDPAVTREEYLRFLSNQVNDAAVLTPDYVDRKLAFRNQDGRGVEGAEMTRLYERGTPQRVLAHVKAPALVLWGGANPALSAETAEAFASAMTHACSVQKILYDGGGHWIHVERPQQTVKDAGEFLDRWLRAKRPPKCRN
jgi:pimeloyl-ACP methyl ester carboxylesterase